MRRGGKVMAVILGGKGGILVADIWMVKKVKIRKSCNSSKVT